MKKVLLIVFVVITCNLQLQAQQSKIDSANVIIKEFFSGKTPIVLNERSIMSYGRDDDAKEGPADQILWKEFIGAQVRSDNSFLFYGKLRNKDGEIDPEVAHNWITFSFEDNQKPMMESLAKLVEEISESQSKQE